MRGEGLSVLKSVDPLAVPNLIAEIGAGPVLTHQDLEGKWRDCQEDSEGRRHP